MTTTSPVWVGIDIGSTELVLHHLPVGNYNYAPGRNFNQAPIDSSWKRESIREPMCILNPGY